MRHFWVAHRYNTLAASMLMHMFYNLMGTLIVDLESRFLPAIVMGMIILISIPMTVSAVTLICLTTNNKKTEVGEDEICNTKSNRGICYD